VLQRGGGGEAKRVGGDKGLRGLISMTGTAKRGNSESGKNQYERLSFLEVERRVDLGWLGGLSFFGKLTGERELGSGISGAKGEL